jgi:hypothetical protein
MWISRTQWLSLLTRLDRIHADLAILKRRTIVMALDLSRITAAVAQEATVDDSVLALVNGMAAQIKDLSDRLSQVPDIVAAQAQLDQLAAQLATKGADVVAAVTANTKN